MDVTLGHRQEVVKKLTHNLVEAMEANKVSEADLPQIADFILERIDKVTKHDELIELLDELSAKWQFFDPIEQLERGEVKEISEDKIEKDVLMLAKAGKVEDAINLAKTAMAI